MSTQRSKHRKAKRRVWRKVKAELEPAKSLGSDPQVAYVSRWHEETERGSHDHNIVVRRGRAGWLSLSCDGNEGFVYLYPEQVRHLRRVLRMRVPATLTVEEPR